MSAASPENERKYEPDNFLGQKFFVEVDGLLVAGFSECSAVTIETEIEEYKEGGLNIYTHKLPTRTKYGNITLKRGIDPGQDLYWWYMDSIGGNTHRQIVIEGHETENGKKSEATGKNVSILIYNPEGIMVKQWDLRRAFPVKWTGPDLKAETGAAAIETLEFAHEGIIFNYARNVG